MSQRVIVTGGSGGIGAAIVERFAADGAAVAVLDRRAPAGESASFFPVDLLDPLDTRRAVGEAIAALGGIDVLVNCAGIFQHASLLDITVDDWDRVLDINARATLVTTCRPSPP